jgi:hypothetical protein
MFAAAEFEKTMTPTPKCFLRNHLETWHAARRL